MARDPYKEFRKGIKVVMYESDSTSNVSATLTANYAIFYDKRKLWEAKGDVVVVQTNGRKLYTQQLFWNQSTHRIYSNVDSRIVDGDELYDCEGFESDENMTDWRYRKLRGVTYFSESESTEGGKESKGDDNQSKSSAEGDKIKVESSKKGLSAKEASGSKPKKILKAGAKIESINRNIDKDAMPIAKPTRDL